jgi:SSS family solute:Na+ symporter
MIFDPGSHFDSVVQKLVTDPSLRSGIFLILNINWLHFCIGLFLFTMLLMAAISFFTPKAEASQLQGLTYFSQSPEQIKETRNSWSTVDVITSLIVLGLCIAFYIYFW